MRIKETQGRGRFKFLTLFILAFVLLALLLIYFQIQKKNRRSDPRMMFFGPVGQAVERAANLKNHARSLTDAGEYHQAMAELKEGLGLLSQYKDKRLEHIRLYMLLDMAINLNLLRHYAEAMKVLWDVLHRAEQHQLDDIYPMALTNLGQVLFSIGMDQEAYALCIQAEKLHKNPLYRANNDVTIAAILAEKTQYIDLALKHYQKALAVYKNYDRRYYVRQSIDMASLLSDQGKQNQANKILFECLQEAKSRGFLFELGSAQLVLARSFMLQKEFSRALAMLEKIEPKNPGQHVPIMLALYRGQCFLGEQKFTLARESFLEADKQIHIAGKFLGRSSTSLYANYRDVYDGVIATFLETEHLMSALHVARNFKKRHVRTYSLKVKGEAGQVQVENPHFAELKHLQRQMWKTSVREKSAEQVERNHLLRQVIACSADLWSSMLALQQEEELNEKAIILEKVLETKPEQVVPGTEEILLEYWLEKHSSGCWVTTSQGTQYVRINKEKVRSILNSWVIMLKTKIDFNGKDFDTVLRDGYDVFIHPISSFLRGKNRLFISPDKGLELLPWAAFYEADGEKKHFLAESAAILFVDRPEFGKKSKAVKSSRVLAVGGCDYSTAFPQGEPVENKYLFPPLPFSIREVERIAEMYHGSLVTLLTGKNSTEDEVQELIRKNRYDILHIASHGLSDPDMPSLSGVILSRPRNSDVEDGFWQTYEISTLKRTASLVVLSACQTGAGVPEDLGMSRHLASSFLDCGASYVVATLWKVNDSSVADFMVDFHGNLKNGISPEIALTNVQRQFIKKKFSQDSLQTRGIGTRVKYQYAHPFHWASYVCFTASLAKTKLPAKGVVTDEQ